MKEKFEIPEIPQNPNQNLEIKTEGFLESSKRTAKTPRGILEEESKQWRETESEKV